MPSLSFRKSRLIPAARPATHPAVKSASNAAACAALACLLPFAAVAHADGPSVRIALEPSPGSNNCPIALQAQLRPGTPSHLVIASPARSSGNPTLLLAFDSLDTAGLVSADITVHGLSGDGRVLDADSFTPDVRRTQTFQLSLHSRPLEHASLSISRMPFITYAEVTELRYADGTSWHPSAASACQATPNSIQQLASAAPLR